MRVNKEMLLTTKCTKYTKKTKKTMAFVFVLCMGVLCGDVLPTNEEISQFYRAAENYKQIDDWLRGTLENLYFSHDSFPSSEVARVHLCVMTNTVERSLATNRSYTTNFSPKRWLMCSIFNFDVVRNDINALNYCAGYINTIRPLSTNDYAVEYAQYAATTNMQAFWMKWKPIQHYNFCIPMFRRSVLEDFWYPIAHYQKSLPEAEVPAFRSNIVTRAGLSQSEADKLFDPEDWFFKPIPPPPQE